MRWRGKVHYTHRLALIAFGPVDPRKPFVACHTCDNRRCCNPDHLVAATQRFNVHDMIRKRRAGWQRRPRGEPYTGAVDL